MPLVRVRNSCLPEIEKNGVVGQKKKKRPFLLLVMTFLSFFLVLVR